MSSQAHAARRLWVVAFALLGLAASALAGEGGRGVVLEAYASPPEPAAADAPTREDPVLAPANDAPAPTAAGGPAVELITGGQSKDGAARVGRLPVLE